MRSSRILLLSREWTLIRKDSCLLRNAFSSSGDRRRCLSVMSAVASANATGNAELKREASPTPSAGVQPSLSSQQYCMDSVKKVDYENYLCSLLLPAELRATGFAIRAFNAELAQIRDVTSDKLIAQMRFQFWKDSLDRIYNGNPPAQPVAQELYRATRKGTLSKLWLRRLLDARLDSLPGKPFPTVEAVETYAENSVSPILYLLLEAANVKDVQADHAASHVGKAVGLVTVIRSVAYFVSRGQVVLPMDLLMRHNISAETVSRIGRGVERRSGTPEAGAKAGTRVKMGAEAGVKAEAGAKAGAEADVVALKDVIFTLAGTANSHIEKARAILPSLPTATLAIYLPLVSCTSYLDRLRAADFDVFAGKLRHRDGLIPFRLWWRLKRRNL